MSAEENQELSQMRNALMAIVCRCSFELQDRPGLHVSRVPGRRELADAIRWIRQQSEAAINVAKQEEA